MIRLKEKLNRLPPDKIADLELIVGKIIETGLAELIILYGSHARGDFKDGKIITVGGSRVLRRSDYDILVVIDRLNLCYIGARYITSFTVDRDEIDLWKPEVEKLLSETEQTCKIKIEALKQIED